MREPDRERLDRLIAAEQDERRRIALFLHDGPVQNLAGIALMLDAAQHSIEDGRYEPRFALSLARKDADLIADAAAAAGIDLRLVDAARTWLVDAEQAGRGRDDYSAVLDRILARG